LSEILWLASYPKSGNTWLRIFLENLLGRDDHVADINDLRVTEYAGTRRVFDNLVGLEASDLTPSEVERYRTEVYRILAEKSSRALLIKAHDAYTCQRGGEPLFPSDVSRGVVYILRNPLDVAVSFANHYKRSIDSAITRMGNETAVVSGEPDCLSKQLRQRIGSWSSHVLSWTGQTSIPVHVLRYEDMISQPLSAFGATSRFAGLETNEEALATAIAACSFDRLQTQEREFGFRERLRASQVFFRQGQVGGWRSVLTPLQVDRILTKHGEVMRRFGYLSESGEINA